MKESPIFARTHDLVLWLLARAESFPRSQRFVLTKRLQDAALDFQEKLVEASLGRRGDQARRLVEADVELGKLRFYLRLCHEMGWLSTGQYGHASRMAAEVGRLLGGWMKKAAPSGGT
jgi:four helix bundle protein